MGNLGVSVFAISLEFQKKKMLVLSSYLCCCFLLNLFEEYSPQWAYLEYHMDKKNLRLTFFNFFLSLRPYLHETFLHTILRYCDKKILQKKIKRHFSSNIFFSCVNWKYLFLDNSVPQMSMDTRISIENHHWCLWFEKILKCNYNILTKKSFNLFIAMSFYLFISILCAKILCVNWA